MVSRNSVRVTPLSFLCYRIFCLRASHMVSSQFPCLQRGEQRGEQRLWSVLVGVGFLKGWCAVMAFLKTQERTKERFVPPLLLLTRRYFRSLCGFSPGSSAVFVSAVDESHYTVRLGHSANEGFTVSCVHFEGTMRLCAIDTALKSSLFPMSSLF